MRVGILGAGTMGAGIAQVAATADCEVALYDVRRDLAEKGKEKTAAVLRKLAASGKLANAAAEAAIARIVPTERLADLRECAVVVEAAPEKLEIKRALFAELGKHCGAETILASNTSSLSIAEIAAAAPHPERVAGMHFFNPAPILPLVEVVRAESTSTATVDRVVEIARDWGKTPVRVRDTPGFIVNRVARPFYLEALRMLEEGVAPIETIDAALEGVGFRMGPGRLVDLIGMDVNWEVSNAVWNGLGRPARLEPHAIQKRMLDEGKLGRKSGRGFYEYGDAASERLTARRDAANAAQQNVRRLEAASPSAAIAEGIVLRTVGMIVNEAALALGDGVASAADIDLAMKLGTNYPKGPLAWGAEIGAERIVALLRGLDAKHPGRYPIAARLAAGELT
jgi:3-hydroxybutyryl-CoA dehydrogenase